MTRPLRLDSPDTFYHVLSRGNEKREIFHDEKDYLRFLEGMGKMVGRFKVKIHAYVLMNNHYHLLIRTQDANLSRAIQWMGVNYSVWFNRRHERSGHLFQGRFKSFLIRSSPLKKASNWSYPVEIHGSLYILVLRYVPM